MLIVLFHHGFAYNAGLASGTVLAISCCISCTRYQHWLSILCISVQCLAVELCCDVLSALFRQVFVQSFEVAPWCSPELDIFRYLSCGENW